LALTTNCTCTRLLLDDNSIVDVSVISQALLVNSTLSTLFLRGNHIADISSLGNALQTNTTLVHLELANNKIVCLPRSFEDALAQNCELQVLNLMNNHIDDISGLGSALQVNTRMEKLYLRGNRISAPPFLADDLVQFMRTSPHHADVMTFYKQLRDMGRDWRALCVVLRKLDVNNCPGTSIGAPDVRLESPFLALDTFIRSIIEDFVWESECINRLVERAVSPFDRIGLASDVRRCPLAVGAHQPLLMWLRGEKRAQGRLYP
jgi:hypothetical protein